MDKASIRPKAKYSRKLCFPENYKKGKKDSANEENIKERDRLKSLTKKELLEIQGGEVSIGLVVGIGGIGVFLIGFLDGLLHPKSCKAEIHE